MGDACYGFLALNFLWGLYNIIMGFRRVKELSFGGHDEQAEFVDEVMPLLAGRARYDAVEELMQRRCPRAAATDRSWPSPTASSATISCARSSRKCCSAT